MGASPWVQGSSTIPSVPQGRQEPHGWKSCRPVGAPTIFHLNHEFAPVSHGFTPVATPYRPCGANGTLRPMAFPTRSLPAEIQLSLPSVELIEAELQRLEAPPPAAKPKKPGRKKKGGGE